MAKCTVIVCCLRHEVLLSMLSPPRRAREFLNPACSSLGARIFFSIYRPCPFGRLVSGPAETAILGRIILPLGPSFLTWGPSPDQRPLLLPRHAAHAGAVRSLRCAPMRTTLPRSLLSQAHARTRHKNHGSARGRSSTLPSGHAAY